MEDSGPLYWLPSSVKQEARRLCPVVCVLLLYPLTARCCSCDYPFSRGVNSVSGKLTANTQPSLGSLLSRGLSGLLCRHSCTDALSSGSCAQGRTCPRSAFRITFLPVLLSSSYLFISMLCLIVSFLWTSAAVKVWYAGIIWKYLLMSHFTDEEIKAQAG